MFKIPSILITAIGRAMPAVGQAVHCPMPAYLRLCYVAEICGAITTNFQQVAVKYLEEEMPFFPQLWGICEVQEQNRGENDQLTCRCVWGNGRRRDQGGGET